jgi:uncharacterized membrane protein YcgQ (UPF0703/DUF1980 family)
MYLSINTYIETETKFYQTGIFRVILLIIAVICMFIPGLQPAGLALAIAAGVSAVAVYLITTLLISLIIQYAITYLVDVLGIQNSIILAIVAVAATVYMMSTGIPAPQGAFGSVLQAASTNLVSLAQQATTTMFSTIGQAQQSQLADLQKQMVDFAKSAKEKNDDLQEQTDKYNADFNYINAMEYVRREPMIVFGESPQAFYDRTVHTPNPGVLCYSAIANYVTNGLKLPTIPSSLTLIAQSQGTT